MTSGERGSGWALLCALVDNRAGEDEAITSKLCSDMDWTGLQRLARRHGVVPLLHRSVTRAGLRDVPPAWRSALAQEAAAHAKRNLLTAREMGRLLALFAANGIPALAFKGPALAQQAYGDLALRQYGDLDILIRPQDVERAAGLLLDDDYFTDGSIFATERPFGRRDGWVVVDLHWGLTVPHLAGLLDETGMWQRARPIALAGHEILTLSPADHLLVLAVHGVKDGWSRLKWVCDVAGLVERHPTTAESALAEADQQGAGRVLGLALGLAHHLLGLELPAAVLEMLKNDSRLSPLVDRAADGMASLDRSGVLGQAWAEFRFQMGALERSMHRLGYLRHRLDLLMTPNAADRTALPLPSQLTLLHYCTRPLRLAWSYALPRPRA